MKIQPSKISRISGSVLVTSFCFIIILASLLWSYLILTGTQHKSVVRAQSWNATIVLSEAGVEDALSLINKSAGWIGTLTDWTNSVVADNWEDLGGGVYHARRTLSMGYYDAYVTNNVSDTNGPTIVSFGTINNYTATILPFYAQIGGNTPAATSFSRNLLVNTRGDGMFNAAMAAITNIDLKGNNIATDSFDGADPNYSDNGSYPLGNLSKTKAKGDVYTDSTVIDSLDVGNANIKGHLKTGPGGSYEIGPNGSVGDRAWVEAGTKGVKDGYFADDFNVVFPPVALPNTTWFWMGSGSYTREGLSFDYVINTSGDYIFWNFDNRLYVGPNVKARIRFVGGVNMEGSDMIYVCATNSRVELYADSTPFKMAGNSVITNASGKTQNIYLFGTPNCTQISYSGNGAFTGGLYAPNAALTMGGGGSDTYDFVGAIVAKSIKMNGHFNFHYDENLARVGPMRGYVAISWKEK